MIFQRFLKIFLLCCGVCFHFTVYAESITTQANVTLTVEDSIASAAQKAEYTAFVKALKQTQTFDSNEALLCESLPCDNIGYQHAPIFLSTLLESIETEKSLTPCDIDWCYQATWTFEFKEAFLARALKLLARDQRLSDLAAQAFSGKDDELILKAGAALAAAAFLPFTESVNVGKTLMMQDKIEQEAAVLFTRISGFIHQQYSILSANIKNIERTARNSAFTTSTITAGYRVPSLSLNNRNTNRELQSLLGATAFRSLTENTFKAVLANDSKEGNQGIYVQTGNQFRICVTDGYPVQEGAIKRLTTNPQSLVLKVENQEKRFSLVSVSQDERFVAREAAYKCAVALTLPTLGEHSITVDINNQNLNKPVSWSIGVQ